MIKHSDNAENMVENSEEIIAKLVKELEDLYLYRDLFFENHPIDMALEKIKIVEERKNKLIEKFEAVDVETLPFAQRAKFIYLKGRCYNISTKFDPLAAQCLSKAVKLNPHMSDAWNELGECYFKNGNVKEAKASFEGALKNERNRLALRCLSILMRQENGRKKHEESLEAINKSVELAKEAVAQDTKDGVSWGVLGNAYLCQFFTISQDPLILKLCLSAYKQAWADPIAKGKPDLYYNWGMALKYEEMYQQALENFDYGFRLDPSWDPPKLELNKLTQYLSGVNDLVRTKGKIKTKKLAQMVQSIDKKMLALYGPGTMHKFGSRTDVALEYVHLDSLQEGANEGKVILGRVVGSIHNENAVPFTFAILDESMKCVCVTVYNWADGRGTIIGDCVAIPEPQLRHHQLDNKLTKYDFKSIRINNPMLLLVNGKRVSRNQFAGIRVSSTYEIH